MDKAVVKQKSQDVEKVERTRSGRIFTPPTDILESENEIIVKADMPGTDKNSIDVTLEDNQLIIEACLCVQEHEGLEPAYTEYEAGDYYRAFSISDVIDREKITADYNEGVLTLTLPKVEKAKAKRVKIK
jgi:HSP20 family protein